MPCVCSLLDNSSVLRSYMRGEALPKDAQSIVLACFLVYRSIPCLRNAHTQLEGKTNTCSLTGQLPLCTLTVYVHVNTQYTVHTHSSRNITPSYNIYSSAVLKCNFEVLVLNLSTSI